MKKLSLAYRLKVCYSILTGGHFAGFVIMKKSIYRSVIYCSEYELEVGTQHMWDILDQEKFLKGVNKIIKDESK